METSFQQFLGIGARIPSLEEIPPLFSCIGKVDVRSSRDSVLESQGFFKTSLDDAGCVRLDLSSYKQIRQIPRLSFIRAIDQSRHVNQLDCTTKDTCRCTLAAEHRETFREACMAKRCQVRHNDRPKDTSGLYEPQIESTSLKSTVLQDNLQELTSGATI
ncbi:hypothetical protein WN48_05553 [Eufriesea mexicana]|uniref:Uncharacterized protein n=1 Tax=Eufriesea mexicana TaxID=516756 RepID=A0A310SVE0_9HYME|nr:hypothetical protein WN48_05553 [Eufriesea mexicana]